jgi:hypothetical protein
MLRFACLAVSLLILSTSVPFSGIKLQPTTKSCPTLTVDVSSDDPCGPQFSVMVSITGQRPTDSPTFRWSVSAGKIISGQGTPTIVVDKRNTAGQTITATVEVDGLEPGCEKIASATQSPCEGVPDSELVYRYDNISPAKERAHLDRLATRLENDSSATSTIIHYNGNRKRAERAKAYLVQKHGIDASRIEIVDGRSCQGRAIELFAASFGAVAPTACSPLPDRAPSRSHL